MANRPLSPSSRVIFFTDNDFMVFQQFPLISGQLGLSLVQRTKSAPSFEQRRHFNASFAISDNGKRFVAHFPSVAGQLKRFCPKIHQSFLMSGNSSPPRKQAKFCAIFSSCHPRTQLQIGCRWFDF